VRAVQSVTPSVLSSDGGRGSYVPEHVRRPHAYTCYTLDAPVVVGSGQVGASDGSLGGRGDDADGGAVLAVQAAMAAATQARGTGGEYANESESMEAAEAPQRLLSSLEFVPRARAASGGSASAAEAAPSRDDGTSMQAAAARPSCAVVSLDSHDLDMDGGSLDGPADQAPAGVGEWVAVEALGDAAEGGTGPGIGKGIGRGKARRYRQRSAGSDSD
jgi:hypothetical protein